MFFSYWTTQREALARQKEAVAMSQTAVDRLKETIARSRLYDRIREANQTFDALHSQKKWCPDDKLRAAQEARNEAYNDLIEFDRKCRRVPGERPMVAPLRQQG